MAISFTNSWFGVIFNPVGYSAQRTSPAKAAEQYINSNPPTNLLNTSYDELSFKENRLKWVGACAAKLKSDDVGKSIANCEKACAGVFDNYAGSISKNNEVILKSIEETEEVEARVERNKKIFIGAVIALLTVTIIFIILKK